MCVAKDEDPKINLKEKKNENEQKAFKNYIYPK